MRVASRMLLASLVVLALGITADFYLVVRKVTESSPVALTAAGLILLCCYGLWFGLGFVGRGRRRAAPM